LTELFEINEIQFGPTEKIHGLEYACPTGKNTKTESNKNSSTLGVIGVVVTARCCTGSRNMDVYGSTRTTLLAENGFHRALPPKPEMEIWRKHA